MSTDPYAKLARQTQALLRRIRAENADFPRWQRNECRKFHRWCVAHLDPQHKEVLDGIAREHLWLLEPDEPPPRDTIPLTGTDRDRTRAGDGAPSDRPHLPEHDDPEPG